VLLAAGAAQRTLPSARQADIQAGVAFRKNLDGNTSWKIFQIGQDTLNLYFDQANSPAQTFIALSSTNLDSIPLL